jgi:acetyl-CoA synthetase
MGAEDPLSIPSTRRIDRKAQGGAHTTGAICLGVDDARMLFDYGPGGFWCTADVGWVTATHYVVYGPLANGATTDVRRRAQPPDFGRCLGRVDKH